PRRGGVSGVPRRGWCVCDIGDIPQQRQDCSGSRDDDGHHAAEYAQVRRYFLQPLERVFTSEHGTVLIATLMVVVLLGTLGAALALAVSTESVTAANYEASQQTLYAADAGIERIVGELRGLASWRT